MNKIRGVSEKYPTCVSISTLCYSSSSGPWHPSKKSPFDWTIRSQRCFYIWKQPSNADLGMAFSSCHFKPPVPLLCMCYVYTFDHRGLLYHFNRLRTTLAEIQAKLDANSLIRSFCYFNCKQMRRTEKTRWTKTHAARDPRRPAGNYSIKGVREGLLFTLIPRRGQQRSGAKI